MDIEREPLREECSINWVSVICTQVEGCFNLPVYYSDSKQRTVPLAKGVELALFGTTYLLCAYNSSNNLFPEFTCLSLKHLELSMRGRFSSPDHLFSLFTSPDGNYGTSYLVHYTIHCFRDFSIESAK
ncbi:hypothetical protein Pelo_9943 [Pelomyxa schiedti]|nr:hypothetical protein Pelo_9943 [Pelomyxa schiedti]